MWIAHNSAQAQAESRGTASNRSDGCDPPSPSALHVPGYPISPSYQPIRIDITNQKYLLPYSITLLFTQSVSLL